MYSDLWLARQLYLSFVEEGELTVADDGYQDPHFVYPVANPNLSGDLKSISQRHETVNKHIKTWGVLSTAFRSRNFAFHRNCFYAVANITQLMISRQEISIYQDDVDIDVDVG